MRVNIALMCACLAPGSAGALDAIDPAVTAVLKARCVKCHGPAKQEGNLNLGTSAGLARGGENGPVVVPVSLGSSRLWQKVSQDEMPPDAPLSAEEKQVLRAWIAAGARGLPAGADIDPRHWSFRTLKRPVPPAVRDADAADAPIDRFLLSRLEEAGLSYSKPADRPTLIRRVSFALTGLPPTPDDLDRFSADPSPDAYERMIDQYLASSRYGERWGKFWLDAVGYADSNGHFSADTDRPLAYRYRDYVIRSLNANKPIDRFLQEQFAGDELAGYRQGDEVAPEVFDLLVATHFLRNAQDGTGESDGNPDEVLADKMAVIEGLVQICGSSLLGLTLQCARCHDHKFEPVTQKDYYALEAVFAPAFNADKWVKPNDRTIYAASSAELAAWEANNRRIDAEMAALKDERKNWVRQHRPKDTVLFADDFSDPDQLASAWSNTAPEDDSPGSPAIPVNVGAETAPGAMARDGALHIIESGAPGDRWISTKRSFHWRPNKGEWIQVTFDLLADKSAARIGYFIALHDFNKNAGKPGGNILLDGNPSGGAAVYVDYPGEQSRQVGTIGKAGYAAGGNYGVRVTNAGSEQFRIEHVVDGVTEGPSVTVSADALAAGGFGFEYCCGRSFVIDNVLIETGLSETSAANSFEEYRKAVRQFDERIRAKGAERAEKPGKIAWITDVSASAPEVFILERGAYSQRGKRVGPAGIEMLTDPGQSLVVAPATGPTTGHRLAFARWLTQPDSRAAALVARVLVNRVWQQYFGMGIVATPENLGYSGAAPSHPELVEFLAAEFVRSGWDLKALHRSILLSAVFRQDSVTNAAGRSIDPDNRLLWRFPVHRLDAESIRDAILAVAGDLDDRMHGPYVPTTRTGIGEVIVEAKQAGARRRSVYLQQRRTQLLTMLEVFDAPSIVTSCTRRNESTIPLQSLSLLNADFMLLSAGSFADRIGREASDSPSSRIDRAFLLAVGRRPTESERAASLRFLTEQPSRYEHRSNAHQQVWVDFCQMLLSTNAFLYLD